MPRSSAAISSERKMISLRVPVSSLQELDIQIKLGAFKDRTQAINVGIVNLLAKLSTSPQPPMMNDKIEYLEQVIDEINLKVDKDLGDVKKDLTGLNNKLELIFRSLDTVKD